MSRRNFLTLLVILTVSCNSNYSGEEGQERPGSISVTDFRGKILSADRPAEKVVCLIESALSGIYMLNAGHRVIGVSGDVYTEGLFSYYSRLDDRIWNKVLPAPGNWELVNLEEVIGLEPDLVILWSAQAEIILTLEKFGIPVYAVMLHSFEDIYKEIRDFGELLGCRERADSLIEYTRSNILFFNRFKNNSPQQKAYFMWAQGINETSGKNSTVNELLKYAGTRNVCELDQEHVTVSMEKLLDWDPDLIVMWNNARLDPGDILEDPRLKGLEAVKSGRVHELPDGFSCDFWTLKFQHPVSLVSGWAYPDTATQVDPGLELMRMYKFLYGKELHPLE